MKGTRRREQLVRLEPGGEALRRVPVRETHVRDRVSLTNLRPAKIGWHGVTEPRPDWSAQSHSLAFGAVLQREGMELFMMTNAFWEALDFELPNAPDREPWRRWIDTRLDSPGNILPWQTADAVGNSGSYRVAPRSVVVLWRRLENAGDGP